MLKSTYKSSAVLQELPTGWSEHKAPSGHSYYFNAVSHHSTYIRPTQACQNESNPPSTALSGNPSQQDDRHGADRASAPNGVPLSIGPRGSLPFGHNDYNKGRGAGRVESTNYHRPYHRDRPKKKHSLPGYEPWFLIETRLGRRYVFNSEDNESFWRFPPKVINGVIEFDNAEREKRMQRQQIESSELENAEQAAAKPEIAADEHIVTTASATNVPAPRGSSPRLVDSDGEEYEEVEVTDDDDEYHPWKRQKTQEIDIEQPVEFNEDDIAYQLAAMGEDYGLDPGEYGNDEDKELDGGARGLSLTEEERKALFEDMLIDFQISPFTTWEKVIEAGHIIDDDRYTILDNMKSRKDVWDEWSRDRIQQLRAQREIEETKDQRIPYFAFLESHGTPKLYWPEFRRKYRNEPGMRAAKVTDKDREKWYREYVNRLKLPERTLKADLVTLLKSTPLRALNRSTSIDTLPIVVLTDMRYISLRKSIRNSLIEAHISSLPPAPADLGFLPEEEETRVKEKQERERRQKAMAERQKQVENDKRRQRGALEYNKSILQEEENEVQKAMKVGKEGLLGYMQDE